MTPAQKAKVDTATNRIIRDSIPPECKPAAVKLDELFAANKVLAGNAAIPNNPNADHDGEWDPNTGTIHINSLAIDTLGTDVLARILVHEAFHAAGHSHPGETQEPYTTWPFSEAPKCVR